MSDASHALLGQTILDLIGEEHCNDVMGIIAKVENNARTAALEEGVKAIKGKWFTSSEKEFLLGIKAAVDAVKDLG